MRWFSITFYLQSKSVSPKNHHKTYHHNYMKRIILLLVAVLFAQCAFAQTPADTLRKQQMQMDSIKVHLLTRITQHTAPYYKLYPTDNMWTFLELETFSGRIWQVQCSTKGPDYRFRSILNSDSLVWNEQEGFAGRFELYKTQNMYNFILLDTFNGRTWQVQWSTEANDRMVLPIY